MLRVRLSYFINYNKLYISSILPLLNNTKQHYCLISRSMIEGKNKEKQQTKESKHKEYSLYGIDKNKKENKKVDLDKIYETVTKLEKYCKFYIKSEGVDFVEPLDPPDSFLYSLEKTRVITPKVHDIYEKFSKDTQRIIDQRNESFKTRAFDSIKKVLKLREMHWGHHHPLTLSSNLIYLSMLEIAKDYDTLYDKCKEWMFYCDKHLRKLSQIIHKELTIDIYNNPEIKEINKEDYRMLLQFYTCVSRLLTDEMVRRNEAKDALELAQITMKHLAKDAKQNVVFLVLMGRNLVNAYLELGKTQQAISIMDVILELQSTPEFPQSISSTFSVNEWLDPIKERIQSTVHLARLKIDNSDFDDAESLIRTALSLSIEHTGKYTALACSIQYELLACIKQNPVKTDQEFEELYLISLDIAKETHKRIKKDIDSTGEILQQKKLATTFPYVRLLRVGLGIYQHSKTHKKLYQKLLVDTAKYWPDQEINEDSNEYCTFALTAVEYFLKEGYPSKALDILAYASFMIKFTYLHPHPTIAYYMGLQVQTQLLLDNSSVVKHFPFIESLNIKPPKSEKTYPILLTLVTEALDMVKRANNNQIHSTNTSLHLYNLACINVIYNEIDKAEDTIFRIFNIITPEYIEKDQSIISNIKKLDNTDLTTLFNTSTLLASIYEKKGYIKRSIKYFQYSCKISSIYKPLHVTDDIFNISDLQFQILRYSNISKCLKHIISLQEDLINIESTDYNKNLLEIYKQKQILMNDTLHEYNLKFDFYKDTVNESHFKSFKIPENKYSKYIDISFDNKEEENKDSTLHINNIKE